ncbi:MAG: hypothetical protein J0L92_26950 [Deltaproteobacteria bacterium]|nr:hypothetical protein [Deltaproteobacteria bacterium]
MALTNKMWSLVAGALLVGAVASGCAASGVGDPCIPEAIPECGFTSRESYVETSSVQCRTRVCLVYRLQGHPERVLGEDTCTSPSCLTASGMQADTCVIDGDLNSIETGGDAAPNDRAARVFCSCRCSAGGGDSNLPLCTCNEGFHCVDLLTQGGAGVRGGYCIREQFCEDDSDCLAGQRCIGNLCGGS